MCDGHVAASAAEVYGMEWGGGSALGAGGGPDAFDVKPVPAGSGNADAVGGGMGRRYCGGHKWRRYSCERAAAVSAVGGGSGSRDSQTAAMIIIVTRMIPIRTTAAPIKPAAALSPDDGGTEGGKDGGSGIGVGFPSGICW